MVAAVGVDTTWWWGRWSVPAEGYLGERAPVDAAAWDLLASLMVALLSLSPGAGVWSREQVAMIVAERREWRGGKAFADTGEVLRAA
ncbi:MAG: hypothetical protein JWM89_163 [Acidimicrobiales bacterium]|nr:hypothetical protein [Acidimicrobiales bacterium]